MANSTDFNGNGTAHIKMRNGNGDRTARTVSTTKSRTSATTATTSSSLSTSTKATAKKPSRAHAPRGVKVERRLTTPATDPDRKSVV